MWSEVVTNHETPARVVSVYAVKRKDLVKRIKHMKAIGYTVVEKKPHIAILQSSDFRRTFTRFLEWPKVGDNEGK